MASTLIHMAVGSEINKYLKKDNRKILLGSIAPDLGQIVHHNKIKSHFADPNADEDTPVMEKFLEKYKNDLNDDFVLGYFIHLYTDYLWFKYFISEIAQNTEIKTKEGIVMHLSDDEFRNYIYNDYTDLNIKVIDEYALDLKIFYEPIPEIKNIITEIPMDRLDALIDKTTQIIKNSKEEKTYLFNIDNVKQFISFSVNLIYSEIKNLIDE